MSAWPDVPGAVVRDGLRRAREAVFRGVSLDSFKNPKVGKGEVSMYGKGQRSGLCVGVLLLSLLVFSAGAEARTYYVTQNGGGDKGGGDWNKRP